VWKSLPQHCAAFQLMHGFPDEFGFCLHRDHLFVADVVCLPDNDLSLCGYTPQDMSHICY